MQQLETALNSLGGRGITIAQLKSVGIQTLSMTTPCSSFIGKWKGIKIYGYHDYPTNSWNVEKA